jgi:wyosine [tRNA(Phe)-imidazoG37] synthetase (radical SAM superfamily)
MKPSAQDGSSGQNRPNNPNNPNKRSYLYGPVPSRRLGLSLGIDLVPLKSCTQNCIYCQLGPSDPIPPVRGDYTPVDIILDQLAARLRDKPVPDYISLAGSGEPTLNRHLGRLIQGIQELTSAPVAVLTNGSLLADKTVRKELQRAAVVLPSLDAHDPEGFDQINRSHPSLSFEHQLQGLVDFRRGFGGQIWLEIFLIAGLNASARDAQGFKHRLESIRPDKIHLNTVARPPAESWVRPPNSSDLMTFLDILGPTAELIVPTETIHRFTGIPDRQTVQAILARRPCTLHDLTLCLGAEPRDLLEILHELIRSGHVVESGPARAGYYVAAHPRTA